ncbi:hypothetical protein DAEQUDRAFT_809253 [Daedalea quercina L-15889]|uniref:C2H2-type domain-containing protein n=1 Tax=Daedalea quercina L-15889 TaxID=1314783 RepID=A0A165SRI6_9APHY|nr:hypothetical protein DAEQUDRAFT_809253 [Daedalea quercina L-15889]
MSGQESRTLWFCRWNWCAQVFERGPDLLDHLKKEHFGRILRVEKKDWDVYLRCNEGQSGLTDSLLQGIPTQSLELSSAPSQLNTEIQQTGQDALMQDHRTLTQPSGPSQTTEDSVTPSQAMGMRVDPRLYELQNAGDGHPTLPPAIHSSVSPSTEPSPIPPLAGHPTIPPPAGRTSHPEQPPTTPPVERYSISSPIKQPPIPPPAQQYSAPQSARHYPTPPLAGYHSTSPPSGYHPTLSPHGYGSTPSPYGYSQTPPPAGYHATSPAGHHLTPPLAAHHATPPPHARSHSFADCDAASSPITTPLASPLPPTPPLHSRVVDAINSAARNATAPALPLPRRAYARLSGTSPAPLPLPRRLARPWPGSSRGSPAFSQGPPAFSAAHNASTSVDSSISAHDVETQLTEGGASATPSPTAAYASQQAGQTVPSLSYPALPSPGDAYPPLRTQAPYDSQDSAGPRVDDEPTEQRPSTGDADVSPASSSLAHQQTRSLAQSSGSPATQAPFASQFNSGRLVLRLDSEPPDAMHVDDSFSAPLQLQTQAAYPSQ